MQTNKLVLFDFDGVIVDSFDSVYEVEKMLRKNDGLTKDQYRKNFEGNFFAEREKVQKVDFTPEEFYKAYQPKFVTLQPVPHMSEVLQQLSKMYPMIIISSAVTSYIKSWLEQYGIADCFIDILGADIQTSKVEKMKRILGSWQIVPSDCVLITDTLGDIREANTVGIPSIAVTYGYHDEATLKKGEPRVIVHTPEEILEAVEKVLASKEKRT
ncbi:MAG: HAD family hydrolase [Patescibacteria group bacterium]